MTTRPTADTSRNATPAEQLNAPPAGWRPSPQLVQAMAAMLLDIIRQTDERSDRQGPADASRSSPG
jgi:hypothetical protein